MSSFGYVIDVQFQIEYSQLNPLIEEKKAALRISKLR